MSQNTLSLKVLEAYTRDVGRGVAIEAAKRQKSKTNLIINNKQTV